MPGIGRATRTGLRLLGAVVGVWALWHAGWAIYHVKTDPVLVAVRARSEIVDAVTGTESFRNVWHLRGAAVEVDGRVVSKAFTGEVSPDSNTRVGFRRIGTDSLFIAIEADSGGARAGFVSEAPPKGADAGREWAAAHSIVIAIPSRDAVNLVFPFSGSVRIGARVSAQTVPGAPILLSGSVELIAKTPSSRTDFVAGRADLSVGDEVEPVHDGSAASGFGFVRVDDGAGVQVVVDAAGTGLRTRRFGSEDAIVVERPFLVFFEEDATFFLIVAALSLIGHAIVSEFAKDYFYKRFFRKEQQADVTNGKGQATDHTPAPGSVAQAPPLTGGPPATGPSAAGSPPA